MNLEILLNNKKDFTLLLINILTPLIYEGFKDMYDDSIKISKDDNTLIVYQNLLRRIPKWNNGILDKETRRIKTTTNTENILDNLIKAVFKSNILLQNNGKDNNFYDKITTNEFIHKCYINCGRELYNYPYLFYTKKVPIIKLKKNQKDCIALIENNVENTIRKMLPMDIILDNFLKSNFDEKYSSIEEKSLVKELTEEQNAGTLSKQTDKYSSVKQSDKHNYVKQSDKHSSVKQSDKHNSVKQSDKHNSVKQSDKQLNKKNETSFQVKNNSSHTSHLFKTNHSNLLNDSKTSDFNIQDLNNNNLSESSIYPDDGNFVDHYSNSKKRV